MNIVPNVVFNARLLLIPDLNSKYFSGVFLYFNLNSVINYNMYDRKHL